MKSIDHGASWIEIGAGLSAITKFHLDSGVTGTASGALVVAPDGERVAHTLDGVAK